MNCDLPWVRRSANAVSVTIELEIYSIDVVLRAAHALSGRCFVFINRAVDGGVIVDFAAQDATDDLRELVGKFSNALLDYRLRALISEETHSIRELIVAQAFCEADLLDRRASEDDYAEDPRGISSTS